MNFSHNKKIRDSRKYIKDNLTKENETFFDIIKSDDIVFNLVQAAYLYHNNTYTMMSYPYLFTEDMENVLNLIVETLTQINNKESLSQDELMALNYLIFNISLKDEVFGQFTYSDIFCKEITLYPKIPENICKEFYQQVNSDELINQATINIQRDLKVMQYANLLKNSIEIAKHNYEKIELSPFVNKIMSKTFNYLLDIPEDNFEKLYIIEENKIKITRKNLGEIGNQMILSRTIVSFFKELLSNLVKDLNDVQFNLYKDKNNIVFDFSKDINNSKNMDMLASDILNMSVFIKKEFDILRKRKVDDFLSQVSSKNYPEKSLLILNQKEQRVLLDDNKYSLVKNIKLLQRESLLFKNLELKKEIKNEKRKI